ncbi:hypothetical protein MA16_Dca006234 [Dendrobium catenatum]|uniref:SOSEKI DIX-like domain-containing protein n=1 Tax=Dendrobium catenatum TaxID=906689 RepID=A0A2I0W9A5_9ASPA|nr:hypothetical protein MA16_Dca006234 [Dendrobium catenatum]
MTVEGQRPPSAGAGEFRSSLVHAIKILSCKNQTLSPPAFGDVDKVYDREVVLRFKSVKPIFINEGGYQSPKKIVECAGKRKQVIQIKQDEKIDKIYSSPVLREVLWLEGRVDSDPGSSFEGIKEGFLKDFSLDVGVSKNLGDQLREAEFPKVSPEGEIIGEAVPDDDSVIEGKSVLEECSISVPDGVNINGNALDGSLEYKISLLHNESVKSKKKGAKQLKGLCPIKLVPRSRKKFKAGYIWQELTEDYLIIPTSYCEYVLKGSLLSPIKIFEKLKEEAKSLATPATLRMPGETL